MANVYFGKMNDAEQCRQHICSGGKGDSYFGGMQPGDYVFIRLWQENTPEGETGTHTHRLWRLTGIDFDSNNHSTARFDEVFTFDSVLIRDFVRLTLFKVNSDLLVLVTRQIKTRGFIRLDLTSQELFDSVITNQDSFNNYLHDSNNYRKIVLLNSLDGIAQSEKDIQLYKDANGRYQIYNSTKSFLSGVVSAFHPERYDDLTECIRAGMPNSQKKSQRKAYNWLNHDGQGDITFLNFWDLFCSSQPLRYNPADPTPEIAPEDSDEEDDDLSANPVNVQKPLNLILYGPPGTGKTYNSIIRAVSIVDGEPLNDLLLKPYSEVLNRFKQLKAAGRIGFITFHQSYSYEDFIEGIKPKFESDDLKYEIKAGVFKDFCEKMPEEGDCCFVIDEINRGNISKIFGELITLIEPTKRLGTDEEMTCILPYSGKEFGIPKNLYILGTMNTADRSLAHLDAALRRRFEFEEMMPDYNLLKGIKVGNIEIDKVLRAMNDRICVLLDREHQIGHSYFLDLKDDDSIERLNQIFRNKVIPLLQEYFYEDYSLIKKVLNDDNHFIIEDQSAYLFNLRDEVEKNYRIPPIERFPKDEGTYLKIYKEIENAEETQD